MKKLFCLLTAFALVVCAVGCGGSPAAVTSPEATPDALPAFKGIEVGEGEFFITPAEFIDLINGIIDTQKDSNPDDKDIQHLLSLPYYSKSYQAEEIKSRGLKVTYTANTEGNLSKFEIQLYTPAADNEQMQFFGFLCGLLPRIFKPESKIDIGSELHIMKYNGAQQFYFSETFDDDILYEYSDGQRMMHTLSISPKW